MARLVLSFLGPFQATLDGQPASEFESNKVRALLAYLAIEADRPHARESLAGLLWPDYPERSALANLRSALANLRGAIGDRTADPPFLLISREAIRFNPQSDYWLDTAALQDTAAHPAADLEAAMALYRGDLLAGFSLSDSSPFQAWLLARREQFHQIARDLLSRLGAQAEQAGDYDRALAAARRHLALDLWDEDAHRRLMRCMALSGRRSLALAQFETLRYILHDDLGVDPAHETVMLYERIRDETLEPFLARGPSTPQPPAPGASPFKGLSFFDEADSALFFGREALTARLRDHVRACLSGESSRFRLLAVTGASGSGKSSIVRAGLVPELRRMERTGPDANGSRVFGEAVYILTPGASPLDALACTLTAGAPSVLSTTALIDDMARDPRALHLAAVRLTRPGSGASIGLVIDQFEELFTLCRDETMRRAFIDNLLYAAEAPGPVVVIIALRADFYAQCAPYENLRQALTEQQIYIGAMSSDDLRRAIEEPAAYGNWSLESGLVDLLLREVGDTPGSLPLLSHALLETWQRREGRSLTLAGYQACGGVTGALTRTAESAYQQFSKREKEIARNIFLRLTEIDEAGADEHLSDIYTRRRAPLSELVLQPEDASQVQSVLTRLADARLITTAQDTAEVTHEALIREWPRLGDWLNQSREWLRLHRHLTEAAQEWAQADHDPSLLYRGARLAQAGEWAATHPDDLNPLEGTFLAASLEEEQAQQQRELLAAQELAEAERRRAESETLRAEEQTRAATTLRRRAVSLALALSALAVLFLIALWLGQTASRNAQAREVQANLATSRELAAAAVSNLSADPERSILLALSALDTADTLEARNALHQSLPELHVQRIILAHNQLGVPGVAFSPDGAHLASIGIGADGFVRIWDTVTGEKVLEMQDVPGDYGSSVDYSPDGRLLASVWGTLDPKVIVWDAITGEQLWKWPGTVLGDVDRLDFGPDGTLLAVANLSGAPTVFDLTTGDVAFTLPGHATVTEAIAFSPDGDRLATGDNDGLVKLWDATTRDELATFTHNGKIHAVAFSPDGERLATAGEDGRLTVWDIPGERPLLSLPTRSGLYDVKFMPDGERVVGTHQEGATTVWDATTGQLLLNLVGHGSTVISVAAAPDNRHIATGGYDGTVRIWDTAPGREQLTVAAHQGPANGLAVGADGRLATVSGDGTAKVWDAATGILALSLQVSNSARLTSIALAPDGDLAAIADAAGDITLVDMGSGKMLSAFNAHDNEIWGLAFSPDGSRLASASWDGRSKVWDTASRALVTTLAAPCWGIKVAFSPDGQRVFTSCGLVAYGDQEVVAYEWDTATGEVVRAFPGAGLEAYGLALSPDGRQLALGYADGSVAILDAASGETLHDLTGHAGIAFGMAFNQDSTRLATSAFDQLAKVWDTTTGQELATLYGNGSNVFSAVFAADDRQLATVGGDGTLRLFLLDTTALVALARDRVTRELTTEECRRYLHMEACPGSKAASH